MGIKDVKERLKAKEESVIKSVKCEDILLAQEKKVTKKSTMSGNFEDKGKVIEYSYGVIEVIDNDDNKSYYKIKDKELLDSIEIGKTYNLWLLYNVYNSVSKPMVLLVDVEEI